VHMKTQIGACADAVTCEDTRYRVKKLPYSQFIKGQFMHAHDNNMMSLS
jgi:hypothetical protein